MRMPREEGPKADSRVGKGMEEEEREERVTVVADMSEEDFLFQMHWSLGCHRLVTGTRREVLASFGPGCQCQDFAWHLLLIHCRSFRLSPFSFLNCPKS
jgi:hypothetical protein